MLEILYAVGFGFWLNSMLKLVFLWLNIHLNTCEKCVTMWSGFALLFFLEEIIIIAFLKATVAAWIANLKTSLLDE